MRLGISPLVAAAPAAGPAAPVVIAASFLPMAFSAISDLWTKDECKVAYDAARQEFYDYEAAMMEHWYGRKQTGQLDYERGAWVVSNMSQALEQFRQYTEQAATACDPDWIRPRFHDFYDHFYKIVEGFRAELATMGGVVSRLLTSIPQMLQSSYASLQFRTAPELSFPQAGFNQPGAVAPITEPSLAPVSTPFDSGLLFKLAIAGALAFAISRR